MGKRASGGSRRQGEELNGGQAKPRPVGEAQWRAVLVAQKASGKSVAAYCRGEGLSESTLRYWSWRLTRDGKRAAPVAPQFLAVPVHAVPSANAPVEVELGAVRVRFVGAEAARITAVVLARLEAAR